MRSCASPQLDGRQPNIHETVHAGFQNFVLVYSAILVFTFFIPVIPLYWVADHFLELISGATILAVSLAVALYGTSHIPGKVLAPSGTSGNPAYDFWMGRELNPRTWTLDWKEFCELYPGMMGWAVINLAFAHKQLHEFGFVRTRNLPAPRTCCAYRSRRSVGTAPISPQPSHVPACRSLSQC